MSALRENYWILKSRKTVRRVFSECIICKRCTVRPHTTLSPPLPYDRVREAQIFEITGVDLCGPLFLRDRTKFWIVLFTCAVFRAVHMELVTSLSTESFILALRRLISRRGRPFTIYSDNGKNLVGTSNELKELSPNLIQLLSEYSHVFSKNKYDVGKIRMEPPRINLTSDLPISMRAHRTSATSEAEINKQKQNLLAAGLIKESNSCYSSRVT
ncbi:integrase catalytic domain-containing protein [Trichonephila clavipes]|nr:integrase catalytic domain-containing protein [Trichonephila clavipes]